MSRGDLYTVIGLTLSIYGCFSLWGLPKPWRIWLTGFVLVFLGYLVGH